ncbi:MAG: hypothetical protein D8H97_42885 [Neisseria sp.]|nr:MAG: hypothetical protein D8H97_42885 [Neisseria sp.]
MEKSYLVKEQHYGDRQYWEGDTRIMEEDDARNLLAAGLIAETAPSETNPEAPAKPKKRKTDKAAESAPQTDMPEAAADLQDKAEESAPQTETPEGIEAVQGKAEDE